MYEKENKSFYVELKSNVYFLSIKTSCMNDFLFEHTLNIMNDYII